jgi:hypothetical protein
MSNQRCSWSGVCLTAQLAIRCLIANYCTRWRCNFRGLSQDEGRRIFLKASAPLSLMTTYQMSLISAGSISLDSTFNCQFFAALFGWTNHRISFCRCWHMERMEQLGSWWTLRVQQRWVASLFL